MVTFIPKIEMPQLNGACSIVNWYVYNLKRENQTKIPLNQIKKKKLKKGRTFLWLGPLY